MALTVKCPTCQTAVVWSATATYRPFCSERCRLIDLGEWASDNRRIADKQPIEAGLGDIDLLALEDELTAQDNEFFRS